MRFNMAGTEDVRIRVCQIRGRCAMLNRHNYTDDARVYYNICVMRANENSAFSALIPSDLTRFALDSVAFSGMQ
jgi:hypothetical protein